jgi:hypothetical protein
MASIFTPCEGGVLKVKNNCASGGGIAVIAVDNFATTAPITGFSLDLSTNHQFIHTLDEFIYVYAFGDRVGELTLTGVAFFNQPRSTGAPGINQCNKVADPRDVYSYYLKNRLSRSMTPTQININGGEVRLIGFLTGLRMEVPDPRLPIMQWSLRFNVIIDQPKSASWLDAANSALGNAADWLNRTFGNPSTWGSGGSGPGGGAPVLPSTSPAAPIQQEFETA